MLSTLLDHKMEMEISFDVRGTVFLTFSPTPPIEPIPPGGPCAPCEEQLDN